MKTLLVVLAFLPFNSFSSITKKTCDPKVEVKEKVVLSADMAGDKRKDKIKLSICMDSKTQLGVSSAEIVVAGSKSSIALWSYEFNSREMEPTYEGGEVPILQIFSVLKRFPDLSLLAEDGDLIGDTSFFSIYLVTEFKVKLLVYYRTQDRFAPLPNVKNGVVYFYVDNSFYNLKINGDAIEPKNVIGDFKCKKNESPIVEYKFSLKNKSFEMSR